MRLVTAVAFLAATLFIPTNICAQRSFVDSTSTFGHFVGLQANALVQEILNFGETSDLSNPFVLKYTLKHTSSNIVLNVGAGFSRSSNEDDNGLITERESYDVRIGPGFQKSISDRLEVGIGADFVWGRTYSESSNVRTIVLGGNIDSTTTVLRSRDIRFGGGVQLNISYKLTPSLLIGTEASCYALSTENIQNSTVDNISIQESFISEEPIVIRTLINDNLTTDGEEIQLNLPIVVYLMLRF